MDNQRLFLFAGLGLILMIIWQQWQIDYGPKPVASDEQITIDGTSTEIATAADVPQAASPSASDSAGTPASTTPSNTVDTGTGTGTGSESWIGVETDSYRAIISTKGGNLLSAELNQYPVSIEEPDVPFVLLSDASDKFFIAQSGLLSAKSPAPDHHAFYQAEQTEYTLGEGQSELRVPLRWQKDGVTVTKTYVFKSDSHVIDIEYTIENNSGVDWVGNQYRQLQRKGVTDEGGSLFGVRAYIGGVISSEENRYEKIDFGDMEEANLNRKITGGWAAIIQHYFLAAWAPAADATNTYYTKALQDKNRYILGLSSSPQTVANGSSGSMKSTLYVGPKIQEDLAAVAENLNLTVDYGFLAILAEPLFWLLKWIHDNFTSNWGWAILVVTLMIKAVFYKLSEISYRSMARMRKLQPKLQSLKERYGDDRAKMGQATMELYKKEKVNPLGGCLPILIQIPVFIALYWVLLESVELRQAPFILWIKDLAIKDPWYILPLIMGATMFIQQKLNPAPVDPIQAKIFMIMPFAFTIFFMFFPAGLVLYWVANNTLSIAQQYYITRHVLAEK